MNFNCHRFNSHFFSNFKFNFNCHAQKIFGIISSVVFGYSIYFIKDYYFSNTTKKIENVDEKIIPYEEKYNQDFDNLISYDESNIPSETLNKSIVSLTDKYKNDLNTLQIDLSYIQSLYFNKNDESDDDDIYDDDEEVMLLKDKILKLMMLLKNKNKIELNVKQKYLNDVKAKLMNSLQNNFILENTPIGNVIMVYNCKKKGFSYYSDKSICNKYLESV